MYQNNLFSTQNGILYGCYLKFSTNYKTKILSKLHFIIFNFTVCEQMK